MLGPGSAVSEGLVQGLQTWNELKWFKARPKLYAKYYVCVPITRVFCVGVVCILASFWGPHSFWKLFRKIHYLKSKKNHFLFQPGFGLAGWFQHQISPLLGC